MTGLVVPDGQLDCLDRLAGLVHLTISRFELPCDFRAEQLVVGLAVPSPGADTQRSLAYGIRVHVAPPRILDEEGSRHVAREQGKAVFTSLERSFHAPGLGYVEASSDIAHKFPGT